MSYSEYSKAFKQLDAKKAKKDKYIKHNKPKDRKFGIATKKCRRCGRIGGHIGKYDLNLCRQCFKQIATKIGFKKYS